MVFSAGKSDYFIVNTVSQIMSKRSGNPGGKKYHTDRCHHSDQRHQDHPQAGGFHIIHLNCIHILTHCFILCTDIGNTCLCDNGILHLVDLFTDLFLHCSKCLWRHLGKCFHGVRSFRNVHFCKSCFGFLTIRGQSGNDHHRFAENIIQLISVFFGNLIF